MSEYDFIVYVIGALVFIVTIAVFIVVFSRINSSVSKENRCPYCRGVLIQAYIVCDDRTDLLICDDCETLFRQFNGGELFEVFGHPPLYGGNHD